MKLRLFEVEFLLSDGSSEHVHWRAGSHLEAAAGGRDYAEENGVEFAAISVSSMTEPENGSGLIYVANDTRKYVVRSGKRRPASE
jgi:hypothetical protein